mgnify:CR=1 FL=1
MGKLNFNKESSVIVIETEIKIGDKIVKPRMILDTGATYTMIPYNIAKVLNLQPEISYEKINIITASGVEELPIVTLDTVQVIGSEAKNIKAVVHDLPEKSNVDGLLGLSFLKNFNINLNFKEGFLEIN